MNLKQNILQISKFLLTLFLFFTVYLVYLTQTNNNFYKSNENINECYGTVFDCENRPLAKNKDDGARFYPMNEVAAQTILKTESYFAEELSGAFGESESLGPVAKLLKNDKGNDIILTIDSDVTQAAQSALEGKRGAVVVLDATTGAVLTMVSSPSFDLNNFANTWATLNEREDAPLLNRAENGLYPPGSIIKPIIVDIALENSVTDEHELFECSGVIDVGKGFTIKEAHDDVHGHLHLKEALIKSCNITFATLAMRLGADKLERGFKRYGFYEPINGEMLETKSLLPDFKTLDKGDTAQIGIGQSTLMVTPLRMALIASAIANDGVMMEPYILDKVISPAKYILKEHKKKELERFMLKERAGLLKNWLEEVVTNGTGKEAKVSGIKIAGKTGTAENGGDKEHAWFIGFAEMEKRKIAFSILVENGGSGAESAAPIARKIVLSLDK